MKNLLYILQISWIAGVLLHLFPFTWTPLSYTDAIRFFLELLPYLLLSKGIMYGKKRSLQWVLLLWWWYWMLDIVNLIIAQDFFFFISGSIHMATLLIALLYFYCFYCSSSSNKAR